MLQQLREKVTSWLGIAILGVAIFVFSFFGIEGYFSSQTDTFAAKVGGHEISQEQVRTQLNQLRERARASNPNADQTIFSTPAYKRQVLDRLINSELLRGASNDLGASVTSSMIASEIGSIPAFQLNGKFDPDTYKAVLRQQGMTPVSFEQRVRDDLTTQVLPAAVSATALAPADEVNAYLRLIGQTRDANYAIVPAPVLTDIKVSDADIKAYYDAHPDAFAIPEMISVHYIEVKADNMTADVQPSDAELQAKYEKDKAKFTTPAQREASHILISVPKNATPEQQKAALAKADKIEKQLKAGTDFATLAKSDSDDLGSKRQGGDLGWIEKGMTDAAFESALFAMHKGEVSPPVLSPEGYHIIYLRDVRPGKTQAFADVKDQLRKELLGSQHENKFREVAGKLTDMIYADPSSLQPAADKLNLKVQTSALFSSDGGSGIFANPAVVKMAFSDQVLKQDMTSDPVNIGSNDMVVMHLASHKAKARQPLASVTTEIRSRILDQRRAKQGEAQAKTLLASLDKNKSLADIASAEKTAVQSHDKLTRMDAKVPAKLLTKIFEMPHPTAKQPATAMVDMGDGSYALVELKAVHPGDLSKVPDAERKSITKQLESLHAQTEQHGMIDILRRNAKIVFPKNPGGLEDGS